MRVYIFLTIVTVIMSFVAGLLTLSIRQDGQVKISVKTEANQIKKDFLEEQKSFATLKSLAFMSSDDFDSLFDPAEVLPGAQKYAYEPLQALYKYSKACVSSVLVDKKNQNYKSLQKAWLWEKFKCGQVGILPDTFFEKPPYIHPFGHSYVRLSLQLPQFSSRPAGWLQEHKQYLHLSELKSGGELNLSPDWQVLASLTQAGQKALFDRNEFIIDDQFVLIGRRQRTDTNSSEEISSYLAFPRSAWNHFVKSKSLIASVASDTNSRCPYQEDSICWTENKESLTRKLKNSSLFILIASFILMIVCGVLAAKKFKNQKHEEERKRFALQALTHELRTPTTSLILNSETLLNKFDQIPEEMQNQILRMCNDIQKLKRLTDVSQQYLFSHSEKNFIKFNVQKIESVNLYIEDILEIYSGQISAQYLQKDCALMLDPHWIAICLKNLVENALQHGVKPVQVVLEKTDSHFEISVTDAGVFNNKKSKKPGLGLGLSIVKRILSEMKGQLVVSEGPTRFILKLRIT